MKNHGLPKKLLKLGLNQVQNCVVGAARLTGIIDFPVPPNSSMRKTSTGSLMGFYLAGLRISLPIATCARREGVRLDQKIRILDFGCGVGRPLLHMTRMYPSPAYYACDIDHTSVAFIQKNYPQVQAYTSKFTPPLAYESDFFDLIYSVSIFSHLNLDDQGIWLRELARILKPGGFALLSTEGVTSLPFRCQHLAVDEATCRARLDREGFYFEEAPDWKENVERQNTLAVTSLYVGIERSYGTTILTSDYIRRHWSSAGFEVCAVVDGVIDGQDLVVLRRT
jgi:SAM-dependent methyltransferase